MIGYASRTGTKRNLAALRAAGWRLLVSATGVWRNEGFQYGIDNGAWTAFQKEVPFDEHRFRGVVALLGEKADWIVIPDVVGAGLESLRFSLSWFDELEGVAPLLLAVQDGMEPSHVVSHLHGRCGLFVGGSTEWKLATIETWGDVARECACYLHVGRVNSKKRIRLCHAAGVDSFDGTSVTRYATTINSLEAARQQPDLFRRRKERE